MTSRVGKQTDDCRGLIDSINAVEFQMNLFFFPTFLSRVRRGASINSFFITRCFHDHSFRGGSSSSAPPNQVTRNPTDAWIVKVIYSLIVLRCCSKSSVDFTCLEYFNKGGLGFNPSVVFQVIERLNNPKLALKFFHFSRMSCEELNHSVKICTFLVKSLCDIGLHDVASKMVLDGQFQYLSLDILVMSCAQAGKLDIVKALLAQPHRGKVGLNLFTYNNLLNLLVKRGQVDEAVCFFREQHLRSGFRPDTYSFNIIIKGLCRIGEVDRAFEFFNDMGSFACSPDVVTYNTLINGLTRANQTDRGCELLREILSKTKFSPDVVTYTSVISGYCKMGKMEEACVLFYEMESLGIRPNSFTYNVLINGFGKAGNMGSAVAMYDKMLFEGCVPDVVTLTSLIDGYCRVGEVDEAIKLWDEMASRKLRPNAYSFAILINALCKGNRLNEARQFLRQLKGSDIVARPFIYNPVIDGFCKAGNVDEANMIMKEMEEKRCKPDKLTFTILIIGHCMKGRMSEAIIIFDKMLTTDCTPDTITINSLISCLLKAGMPKEANKILLTVSERDFDLSLGSAKKVHSLRKDMDIPVAL